MSEVLKGYIIGCFGVGGALLTYFLIYVIGDVAQSLSTYLVDVFIGCAASAIATLMLQRFHKTGFKMSKYLLIDELHQLHFRICNASHRLFEFVCIDANVLSNSSSKGDNILYLHFGPNIAVPIEKGDTYEFLGFLDNNIRSIINENTSLRIRITFKNKNGGEEYTITRYYNLMQDTYALEFKNPTSLKLRRMTRYKLCPAFRNQTNKNTMQHLSAEEVSIIDKTKDVV